MPEFAQQNHWLFCFSLDNLCPARRIPGGCVFEKSHDKDIISEAAGCGGLGSYLTREAGMHGCSQNVGRRFFSYN